MLASVADDAFNKTKLPSTVFADGTPFEFKNMCVFESTVSLMNTIIFNEIVSKNSAIRGTARLGLKFSADVRPNR